VRAVSPVWFSPKHFGLIAKQVMPICSAFTSLLDDYAKAVSHRLFPFVTVGKKPANKPIHLTSYCSHVISPFVRLLAAYFQHQNISLTATSVCLVVSGSYLKSTVRPVARPLSLSFRQRRVDVQRSSGSSAC